MFEKKVQFFCGSTFEMDWVFDNDAGDTPIAPSNFLSCGSTIILVQLSKRQVDVPHTRYDLKFSAIATLLKDFVSK